MNVVDQLMMTIQLIVW